MAETEGAPESASHKHMIGPLETEFWAAVEDCLVSFHQFSETDAKQTVRDLWRRLAQLKPTLSHDTGGKQFDDMIYHAEPWDIACNLAGRDDLPLESYRLAYDHILKNHLA